MYNSGWNPCMSCFDWIYSGRGGKHSTWVFEKHTDEFNNETEIASFVSTPWAIKLHRSDSQNHIHNVIPPKLKQLERESCGVACVAPSLHLSNGCNHLELLSALCTLHQTISGHRGNGIKPHATDKQPKWGEKVPES